MCERVGLVSVSIMSPGANLALEAVTRLRTQGTVAILLNNRVLDKYLLLISNLHVKISSVSKVWKCFGFFNDEIKTY